MTAYMTDPSDTVSPRGMLAFLQKPERRDLMSAGSTRLLLEMMGRTTCGGNRLQAGLPRDARLAHRPGTADFVQGLSPAHNDIGIVTLADRRAYAIAVFLSGATLDNAGRDAIIARVAGAAIRAVG